MQEVEGFRVGRPLGSGAFGNVVEAVCTTTRKEVALKIASNPRDIKFLQNEKKVIEALSGQIGFPMFESAEFNYDRCYISMELLGKSLSDVIESVGVPLTLKTVLMIADQLLIRLETMHRAGFVHCDLKPGNMLLGIGKCSNTVYLIDFGLSKEYQVREETRSGKVTFEGTAKFASIAAHNGLNVKPKDDLESLGYNLIYLITGKLPWSSNGKEKREFTSMMKSAISVSELCAGLPREFELYFEHVKALKAWEAPDYAKYRQIFRELFIESGYVYDFRYDWVERKAHTMFNFRLHRAGSGGRPLIQRNSSPKLRISSAMTSSPSLNFENRRKSTLLRDYSGSLNVSPPIIVSQPQDK